MTNVRLPDGNVFRFPAPKASDNQLGDLRFRKLLGADAWNGLPPAVRARFGKRLSQAKAAVYTGEIVETRMSGAGWLLAQALRLIGAPLPTARDNNVPAVVTVTEDEAGGGQFWTRQYGRHNGFPQVIHSAKRFAGKTGLEEYVGHGIGMALTVDADDYGLHFRSAFYFLSPAGRRLRLPAWLTPGQTTVTHADLGDGSFAFVLELMHPWFGELIRQTAVFRDG
jgi:Domain of unknown function (DUF4166)